VESWNINWTGSGYILPKDYGMLDIRSPGEIFTKKVIYSVEKVALNVPIRSCFLICWRNTVELRSVVGEFSCVGVITR
jgi:hypothetical protein